MVFILRIGDSKKILRLFPTLASHTCTVCAALLHALLYNDAVACVKRDQPVAVFIQGVFFFISTRGSCFIDFQAFNARIPITTSLIK